MEKSNAKKWLIIAYILTSTLSFVVILLLPTTRSWFGKISLEHPFIMGFIKFALLATAGELIALLIKNGTPTLPCKVVWRFVIWGLIGVWITFMMKVFSSASVYLIDSGILPGKDSAFLKALYTSVLMNTSFGPTFMAVHKCTDKMLELSSEKKKISLSTVITGIDWTNFFGFTIIKTVPFFWIPAHTITFMLPAQYQVIMAAALSVALGVFLSFGSKKKIRES